MIKKLKTRFIVLAMASLAVLLALIVTGMNIVNYRTVVSDADRKIEILEENADRMLGGPAGMMPPDGFADFDDRDDFDGDDGPFFGRGGAGGPSMSRDEAEESRFFEVVMSDDGSVRSVNTERISSIDDEEAGKMAQKALASGSEEGFVGEFRYSSDDENGATRILFLDCGRTLGSFRSFLRTSVLMSLLGLLAVFFVILYFAGRIVRPVAESYEKQKRFITDAGHEIRTPLAIIRANIDLMEMELDGKRVNRNELREDLGDIRGQVDRLTGLTEDLVYLSRMEESGDSLVMTELPFSDIVSETADSFGPLATDQGKRLECDIAPMISVKGSQKELEKLLSIFLENAVKYSAGDSGIGVTLRKEGKNAVLEIRNETEEALTNESLSHVFERFYRTDSSRSSATGGHGIGLSVAAAIVEAHGGKVSARTDSGQDFIVTATLPAV